MYSVLNIVLSEANKPFLTSLIKEVIKKALLTGTDEAIRAHFYAVRKKKEIRLKQEAENEKSEEKSTGREEDKDPNTG